MRQFILILPLLIAAAAVLPPPSADSATPQTKSTNSAPRPIPVKADAAETFAAPVPPQPDDLLATSEPVECSGVEAFLEAVSVWEIPERNDRTEKKLKLVVKNTMDATVTLPHRGVNDLRLSRAGAEIEGCAGLPRSRRMPLPLVPHDSGIIIIRAILAWENNQLALSFHDEMGRMWSFTGLQAGAYEIAALYWTSASFKQQGFWTGPLETGDLRIRLVPCTAGKGVQDRMEF